jgi:hypothetical protein
MANITVTHSFVNGTTADATEVNTNFTDIINGTSDGTKDFSINALTCAGAATLNGNVTLGNATGDTITPTGRLAADLDPSADNARDFGASALAYKAMYSYDFFASLGAVGTPSFAFNGDTDTGMWSSAANVLNFSAGGTEILEIDGTSIDSTVPIIVPLGAVGAPTYSFTGDTDTGMWSSAANTLNFSTGGTERARFDSSGNFGIGKTPTTLFTVLSGGAGTNSIELWENSDTARIIEMGEHSGSGNGFIQVNNAGGTALIALRTTGDSYFNAGNLIVGATSPEASGDKLTVDFGGTNSFTSAPGMSDRVVIKGGTASSDLGVCFTARDGQASYLYLGNGSDVQAAIVGGLSGGELALSANGSEAMRINSSQRVSIGTSAPIGTELLRLYKSSYTGNLMVMQTDATSGDVTAIQFGDGAGGTFGSDNITIDSTNNQVDFNTTSDRRIKMNFADFNGSDLVRRLKPCQFEKKANPGTIQYGFIAQDVNEVYPIATTYNKEHDSWGLNPSRIVGINSKAIIECLDRLDALEAKVA